jgi:hypothetical protein
MVELPYSELASSRAASLLGTRLAKASRARAATREK